MVSKRIHGVAGLMHYYISDQGLPLKVKAMWTDNDYWDRRDPGKDELACVNVAGWLITINGKKYPRGHTDGDGTPDWTYRYTADKTESGKRIAIGRALQDLSLIHI